MTSISRTTGSLPLLAILAVIVLVSGGLAAAPASDGAGDETSAQAAGEQFRGGCRRATNQTTDASGSCACRHGAGMDPGARGMGRGPGPGPAHGAGAGMGHGMGSRMGQGRSGTGSPAAGHQGVMEATRALVHDYRQDIVREIEDVENGVATITRAPGNPEAVAMLQRHVGEMKDLLEGGGRIRAWDPLFSEIFDHYDEVEIAVEALEDGIRVTETSANPEVVKLIRAHARKVSEFVALGPEAVHQPTALPSDYLDSE